jgi:hypothetical protein
MNGQNTGHIPYRTAVRGPEVGSVLDGQWGRSLLEVISQLRLLISVEWGESVIMWKIVEEDGEESGDGVFQGTAPECRYHNWGKGRHA